MNSALNSAIEANLVSMKNNAYPGRGIILGMTPDSRHMVQVYWLTGRSENSRNRVFEIERNQFVRTKAFDEKKLVDPTLVIYFPVRVVGSTHIVTNGDQTDTIYEALQNGDSFESALRTREFEPDAPNHTPRISGITQMDRAAGYAYKLSILKTVMGDGDYSQRHFFEYPKGIPGVGHCITTYTGDGNPLPSFVGEPYPVRMFNDIEETARLYWSLLNEENRVSLLVKFLCVESGESHLQTLNKHCGD